ncbi:MAG: glycosyltransferase [Aquabacterium sp.]|nr:MAG: glycosyltransferase [Aquabacterium sp.]
MPPALSVAIPAHNEEKYIARCIESVRASARDAGVEVEIVVALNRCTDRTREVAEALGARCVVDDRRCIAAVRNAAVRATTAAAVATIDADSWMAPGSVAAILRHVHDPRYVGGGATIWPERWSLGLFCSSMMVMPYVIRLRITAGMFWFLRERFDAVGGFDEDMVSVEDVDFALRLKAWGRARGLRWGTLWRHGITTSCRKFDRFGDWYFVRNPRVVRELFEGHNRKAADLFYYDFDH